MAKLGRVKVGTIKSGVRKKRILKHKSLFDFEEEFQPVRSDTSDRLNNDFFFGHKVQNFMEMDFNEKSYSLCNSCRLPRK